MLATCDADGFIALLRVLAPGTDLGRSARRRDGVSSVSIAAGRFSFHHIAISLTSITASGAMITV
jgi:hypothetical protein